MFKVQTGIFLVERKDYEAAKGEGSKVKGNEISPIMRYLQRGLRKHDYKNIVTHFGKRANKHLHVGRWT